jgi:hypothetical protein
MLPLQLPSLQLLFFVSLTMQVILPSLASRHLIPCWLLVGETLENFHFQILLP